MPLVMSDRVKGCWMRASVGISVLYFNCGQLAARVIDTLLRLAIASLSTIFEMETTKKQGKIIML